MKIPEEVYKAYLKWQKLNTECEKAHESMSRLIQGKIKPKGDIERAQVIINLARVRLGTMTLEGKAIEQDIIEDKTSEEKKDSNA